MLAIVQGSPAPNAEGVYPSAPSLPFVLFCLTDSLSPASSSRLSRLSKVKTLLVSLAMSKVDFDLRVLGEIRSTEHENAFYNPAGLIWAAQQVREIKKNEPSSFAPATARKALCY